MRAMVATSDTRKSAARVLLRFMIGGQADRRCARQQEAPYAKTGSVPTYEASVVRVPLLVEAGLEVGPDQVRDLVRAGRRRMDSVRDDVRVHDRAAGIDERAAHERVLASRL